MRRTSNSTTGRSASTGRAGARSTNSGATPAQVVQVSAIDTIFPTIPTAKADEILALCKHKELTKCEGEPTYEPMTTIRTELAQNARAIKVHFQGGKHGVMGVVLDPAVSRTMTGEDWHVPASKGKYPTFTAGATEAEKKVELAEFITVETDIKIVQVATEVLRNQLTDAVDEDYIAELYDPIFQYENHTPAEILAHIFENYAGLDDQEIEKNRKVFEEPPDLSKPIDVYYRKQEKCQAIATDGKVAISEAEMVTQLQLHLGKTGTVNTAYLAWKDKGPAERTWKNGKSHFRKALKGAADVNKLTANEAGFGANAARWPMAANEQKEAVRDELRAEMHEALDNMAYAATTKQESFELLVAAVTKLTAEQAKLAETIKSLEKKVRGQSNGGGKGNGGKANSGDGKSYAQIAADQEAAAGNNGTWPEWTDPNAYCWSCGYKVRKGHTSETCKRKKDGHTSAKCKATRANTMGGSQENAGWGFPPNGK